VEAHERVGVVPVPARSVAPVHEDHVDVGRRDQRVDERHARCARADDEVVGLEFPHVVSFPPERRVRRVGGAC
jgi:hypothetical protein